MNLFSIDEQKLSSLIIVLLVLSGCAVFSVLNYGDIPENLKDLIETIAFLIAGVNGVNLAMGGIKK